MNVTRFVFIVIAGAAVLLYHLQRTAKRRAVDLVTATRRIVNFSYSGAPSIDDRLSLRAIPNIRLVRVFGINNSFTTADRLVHKRFLARASYKLQGISCSDWQDFYSIANAFALRQSYRRAVPLAKLVRRLCFRVVLRAFLHVGVSDLRDRHVSIVTEEINQQWVKSKSSCDGTLLTQSDTLNESLVCLLEFGPWPPPTPQQALEIIMPAYETLWRVVLLTFVSACHRSSSAVPLDEFGIPACLGTNTETERCALQIGKASLRLYPSTKRVRRQSPDHATQLSADIERCHRDPYIWGSDALEFKPSRFDNLTELQQSAYLPFGLSPHICPAYKGFGDRIVTLAAYVLGNHFGASSGRIRFGDADLDDNLNTPLPTGRVSMEMWSFIRHPTRGRFRRALGF